MVDDDEHGAGIIGSRRTGDFSALRYVLTRAADEALAVRALRRASLVAVLVAVASVLIADVWLFASPIGGWPQPNVWLAPFPFGSLEVSTKIISGS